LTVGLLASAPGLRADTFTYTFTGTGSQDSTHTAKAVFTVDTVANTLKITLSNTSSTTGGLGPGDMLTGLFFDISGTPSLNRSTATADVASTSSFINTVVGGLTNTGSAVADPKDIRGEFSFDQKSSGSLSGVTQHYGIGTSGYSTFGSMNTFQDGSQGSFYDRNNKTGPDGVDFGLAPSGSLSFNGNNDAAKSVLIQNAAVFVFSGTGLGMSNVISNPRFQWGTALNEDSVTTTGTTTTGSTTGTGPGGGGVGTTTGAQATPEPMSAVLLGLGVTCFGAYRWRASRRTR
jgi:hypothetical protein